MGILWQFKIILKKMQVKCDGFSLSMDLDKLSRLRNVFWSGPISMVSFKNFGDISMFDTTYFTNKYDMSLALFHKINHHGLFILLVCKLIHVRILFILLFRTWISCISGSPPIGIIIYQDKAMK